MRFRALWVAAVAFAGALATRDARAVGTRTFELDTLEKLSGGDLKGVSVGSDGVVRAGWMLGDLPLPEGSGTTATCAVELADGSVLVGTGPSGGGKVVRIAGDRASVFADTHESAVNALAIDKAGAVFAATTSNKIYRVTQGKAEVAVTLEGVESVFALVADRRTGALYAGTGAEGRVMRIEPGGASSVFFKAEEPFVVSLAVADDGAVYAGTSGRGVLYRIAAAGRATVVYDFRTQDAHSEDVHAIALGQDRVVWAIANEGAGGSSESTESSSSRRALGGRSAPGPSSAGRTKPGKGSLWRFDAQGRPERVMHHDEFHYVSLALDDRGAPFVGTGAEGRVYTVDEAHRVSLVADTDERQIGALHVSGKVHYALGSDPAAFHRVLSVGGPDSVWTSKPLDAGLHARFGHIRFSLTGTLEVSTRTGDTQTPDGTWSAWSPPVATGAAVASPAGRFVQIRARMRDAAATISDVTLPFVTENLRAVVTEVAAHPKGSHEPRDKEGVPASGSEPPKHDAVLHVTWKVDNPDNDELRYRVQFRREGQSRWLDATTPDDVLTKSELDWDTSALPEGKYRVRVDASDELANPPTDTTRFALETAPVLVDNTPPIFKVLAVQGRRLRVEVVDGLGPIVRVEATIDGRVVWRPLPPADGIFDTADESVDTDLTPLLPPGPGPYLVTVRAYDGAGNYTVREIEAP
jgi:uncharacterized repeat protein (TIGR03803 family)